ncbi:MAG TPA: Gfo/Idh/MocA family oxidoreductase [Mycobacteriales bacterium]|jgi:predicted dehydrogenase
MRVGLLGYGLGGAVFHAPLIAATPGLDLAAVVTSDPGRQAEVRAAHPDAEVVASADELWTRDLDLAVVATTNRTHVELARAAVDAGVPVVVDKPLATSAADGRALVAYARERGVPLTTYQNRRWDGDFLTLRRLVADGELGEVYRFESRFERWRPTAKPGWREHGGPAEGGGILLDLGSHLIDQALLLFGPAASVYAEVDARRPGVEVDDDVFLALTHAGGTRSHLWMSAVAGQLGPRFRVLGSRAAYVAPELDSQEAALRSGGAPAPNAPGLLGAGDDVRTVETVPGAYLAFYAGVRDALADGTPMPVDPADSVAVLEVVEAARRSARIGAPVST